MKNYILLTIIAIVALSCESKTVEVDKVAGQQLRGDNIGNGFTLGSNDDMQTTLDVIYAYAEGNFDLVMEKMADTCYFRPEKGGEWITLANPFGDFLQTLHDPYDSIVRSVYNAVPIKSEGSEYTIVSVPFSEIKYGKDGTVVNESVYERFWLKDGKIERVVKWVAESN